MNKSQAITGAEIFDGEICHRDCALIVDDGRVASIVEASAIPSECEISRMNGGLLAPAFVDLQVNGGGGVLLNDQPSVDAIETICRAHATFGTGALLPTLITDTPEITDKAIGAAITATQQGIAGFAGLHLEGPFLSVEKSGAHDPQLIRVMNPADLDRLLDAKQSLDYLMVTVAPGSVSNEQITQMAEAGIVVSLGHSAASYRQVMQAAEAGARCVTHLFNAMSPLEHREPGMVGGALMAGRLFAGLIADGFHVDEAAIRIALAAKQGPGRIFLVTDAMSTIGTDQSVFTLNGREIRRAEGRLTLEDGTLAGADLDMSAAVRNMIETIGLDRLEAIRMASLYPAACIGADDRLGRLKPGYCANIVHLDDNFLVQQTWIDGDLQVALSP